jgi:hypothetical protein
LRNPIHSFAKFDDFSAHSLQNFLTMCLHMVKKFCKEWAEKSSNLANKAGYARCLVKRIFWIVLLFYGCSPNSPQEFHREGEARCLSLIRDLDKIENREQLLQAEPQLKKYFSALTDLMIEAREFQRKRLDDACSESPLESNPVDALLEEELRRIYMIEGGREVIERAQQEALVKIDAYERALVKKRESNSAQIKRRL